VEPRLVAAVEFTEWTADGKLRHPSYQGLREDKEAATVMREEPRTPARKPAAGRSGAAQAAQRGLRTAPPVDAKVAGVVITHPDRLVIAESRVTKLVLARYFDEVWEHLAPHLRGRPVSLVRCPGGAGAECFFQKHLEDEVRGIRKVDLSPEGERDEPYPVIVNRRGLVELAQRSTVEIHLWGARADAVAKPDRLVIDLDPGPGVSWRRVAEAARLVRSLLEELGLASWAMATGGKGLHVVSPLARRRDWAEVKGFAAAVARLIVRADPRSFIAKARKSERAGRVFVDYLRNGRGATAIAPYCPRTRPGAPVAVPLDWAEIDAREAFDVETVRRRLASRRRDPWQGFFASSQSITATALRRLDLAAAG
jgi:bifunctional non-homologous end joining protein LigD